MDAPNRLPPMGWPWDQMADAVLRWDDANRRHYAAVVAGDVNARERAALDREQAQADREAVREEVARQWLLGLRLAIEQEPTQLATLLGELPPSPLLTSAIDDLSDRVDAVEDVAFDLVQGQAVRCG